MSIVQDRKEAWLKSDKVSEKDKNFIKSCNKGMLEEMFGTNLTFGTAGLRALLGPGTSRMNALTVRRATIGVARYLMNRFGSQEATSRGVAISFDNRHYSKEFRDIACRVFIEHGIKVYTFHNPHPTPELSYTIRKLNCLGGIMITASHNQREYNGYKFYDENGCQGVYETIDELINVINSLPDELSVNYHPLDEDHFGIVTYLDENPDFDKEYINEEARTSLFRGAFAGHKKTKIVFSPSCGCNCIVGPMLLTKIGYEFAVVPGQDKFDPDFTNMEDPNPENDAAYKGAISFLNTSSQRYNLILVTDPDADRCGLAFLDSTGKISRLTGNQIGALLLDYKLSVLKENGQLPKGGVVCTTFVSTSQAQKICDEYGVNIRILATGFKYIGNLIDKIKFNSQKFLFGFEESYGYLLDELVRDKDSLQAIIAIADMNEYYLRKGLTLDSAYEKLCSRTGTYYNTQKSIEIKGAGSLEKVKEGINKLRLSMVESLGTLRVKTITDYLKRTIINIGTKSGLSLDDNDVDRTDCIRYDFKDGGYVAIRPSGTEPKVKIYFEIYNRSDSEASILVDKIYDQIRKIAGF